MSMALLPHRRCCTQLGRGSSARVSLRWQQRPHHPALHRRGLVSLQAAAASFSSSGDSHQQSSGGDAAWQGASVGSGAGGSGAGGGSQPARAPQQQQQQQKQPSRLLRVLSTAAGAAALALAFCQARAFAAATPLPAAATITTSSSSSKPAAAAARAAPLGSVTALQTVQSHVTVQSRFEAPSLSEKLQYRLMQLFAMPAYGKVLAVVAVALPIVGLGGMLYRAAVGDTSWQEAMSKAYLVLNDCPGADVQSGHGWAADLVLHLVYLLGLFTFAVVLGIVTDDISTAVDRVRRGNHPVIERNHIVVLNWNSQTVSVLKQMATARHESGGKLFPGPVVVLADKDRDEMEEAVQEELEGSGLEVITRSGNPAKPSDQLRAAAAAAETVVLLWPSYLEPADASAQQAAVLSALKTAGGVAQQKVVVQTAGGSEADEYNAAQIAVDLARSSTNNRLVTSVTTSGSERMNQIMAQVANQPGLEDVLADLLEYEDRGADEELGAEFYLEDCPEHLEGKSYQQVRRSYARATVIGWISDSSEQLHLNSHDNTIVQPGSKLVLVSGAADRHVPLPEPYQVSQLRTRGRSNIRQPPRNITVLCFDASVAANTLSSIVEFSSKGSHLTLVCDNPDHEALKEIKHKGIQLHVVAGNPSSKVVLTSPAARLEQADAVVLSGLYGREDTAADAQVVASVLQLQSLAAQQKKRKQPLAIVANLNSPATEDVLWHMTLSYHAEQRGAAADKARHEAAAAAGKKQRRQPRSPEEAAAAVRAPVSLHLLRKKELMSGMLTQTACSPQLAAVFSELFSQQTGHEIYLRDPRKAYGLPLDRQLAWKEVQEVVRRRGQTAIGFTAQANREQLLGHQAEVHLAVPADWQVELRSGDKLVVIALD